MENWLEAECQNQSPTVRAHRNKPPRAATRSYPSASRLRREGVHAGGDKGRLYITHAHAPPC
eukprot:5565424-Pyramimonas_sp.AAC.1